MERAQHEHTQRELDLYAEAKFKAWNIALGHAYARNPAAYEHFKRDIGGFDYGPIPEELRPKLAAAFGYLQSVFDGVTLRPDLDPAPPVVARQPQAKQPPPQCGLGMLFGAWMVKNAGAVSAGVLVLLLAIYAAANT